MEENSKKSKHTLAGLFRREKEQWVHTIDTIRGSVNREHLKDEFETTMNADMSKLDQKKARLIDMVVQNALAVITVFSLTCFIYGFVGIGVVEGASMEPTYSNGDLVLVGKKFYGLDRGDVILFYDNNGDVLIKRVIAFGGEYIRITDGTVYVDEIPLQEDYLDSSTRDMDGIYVEENCYYVMGDNRWNSLDSREFGPVSQKAVIGKVIFGGN